jgi:enoyl-CoA hydratase/carnithine racemase
MASATISSGLTSPNFPSATHRGLVHSQMWHRVFDRIQYSRVPVIAAEGRGDQRRAELACAAHIRVAEPSAYFALPRANAASSSAAAARCVCRG